MMMSKEELMDDIEQARRILNRSIDEKEKYEEIYKYSIQLDSLIEQYIVAGF